MADGTGWPGEWTSGVILEGGSTMVAECGVCGSRSVVPAAVASKGASRERLEGAIRCTCGGRGGRLYPRGPDVAAEEGGNRCWLFHA